MRTLKITLIATAIATGFSFWAGQFGIMQKVWPEHPQLAGFFLTLVVCIVVQIAWPKDKDKDKNKEWLGGQQDKS